MSDDTGKKDEGFAAGVDDEFDAELDAWGDLFDDLHEADAADGNALLGGGLGEASTETPALEAGEGLPDLLGGGGELDFTGEAQALGSMLGQPESLPLAESGDDEPALPAVAIETEAPAPAEALADSGEEVTRIASADILKGLTSEASELDMGQVAAEREVTVELDDEFYDDIEIGEGAGQAAPEAPAAAPAAAPVRRLNVNIARRRPVEPPQPSGPAVVLEVDDDLSEPIAAPIAEVVSGKIGAEGDDEGDEVLTSGLDFGLGPAGSSAELEADEEDATESQRIAARAAVADFDPTQSERVEAAAELAVDSEALDVGLDLELSDAALAEPQAQPEPELSDVVALDGGLDLALPEMAEPELLAQPESEPRDVVAMPDVVAFDGGLDLELPEMAEADAFAEPEADAFAEPEADAFAEPEADAFAEPEAVPAPSAFDAGLDEAELEPAAVVEPDEPTPFVDLDTGSGGAPFELPAEEPAELAVELAVEPLMAADEPALDELEPAPVDEAAAATPFVAATPEPAVDLDDLPLPAQATVAKEVEALVLPEVDVAPEFPSSRFAGAEPALNLDALELPFEAAPNARAGIDDAAERLAVCQREIEQLDEAKALARMHLEAGRLASAVGDQSAAQHHFEAAAEANPRSVLAAAGRRRIAHASGDWEAVIDALSAEIELSSSGERRGLSAWRTDLLLATYERERAWDAAAQQLRDTPSDLRALLAAVELAYAEDRHDQLPGLLTRLAEAAAGTAVGETAQLMRARALERSGDAAAVEAYVGVLRHDPSSRVATWGLERIALREGRPADAAQAADRVLHGLREVDPDLAAALARYRGRLAAAAGDNDAYVASLEAAAALSPGDTEVQADLAAAYERRGDAAAAVRAYLTCAASAPSVAAQADAYRRAARLLAAGVGSALDTVEAVRRLVALDPFDSEAHSTLAAALAETGDFEALLALDRAAAEADGEGGIFERILLAKRLVAANRIEDARRELETARERAPHSPVVADTLVRVLGLGGMTEQRAVLMSELAEAESDYRDPEISAIRAAHAAEDFAYELLAADSALAAAGPAARERAMAAWRRVLEIDPSLQGGHAALLRLAELSGDRTAVADALAGAQASVRHPARAMGLALRRNALLQGAGDVAGAEEVLREARAMAPADPRTAMALVALTASAGRWADAAFVFEERAAALGGSPEAQALRFRAAAMLHEHTEEASRVVEILAPVVAAYPDFAPAATLLEQAHRRLGDTSLLSADFERKLSGGDESDRFNVLVREAELYELQVGEAAKAAHLYGKALELRSADPLARDGFERTSAAAGETGPLSQLALDDLKHADEANDPRAKAEAYEELARIDAELRGDPGSARFSYESAAKIDPTRWSVLRALELAYASEGRLDDLQRVYDWQIQATPHPADAVHLSLTRAWALLVLKKPARELLAEYKRAFELDQRCGMALLQLEAAARREGPSQELAALEEAVARYFDTDERGRAAFLTRAGETRHGLGDVEGAIACFRAAVEALPGYWPALAGWRRAALQGQLWLDVGESAVRQAEYTTVDSERAALEHLAGVAFMDRAMSAERAVPALRRVLTLAPDHVDAYLRLRMLFEEQGSHEDLAQLLEQRLEVEPETAHKVEILRALAGIHAEYLEQPLRAKEYLRAALAYDKENVEALSSLARIASEQGEWLEAAGALIAHAKIATERAVIVDIFRQLGRIHTEHVPDVHLAIGAYQKVLSYDGRDEESLDRLSQLCQQVKQWKVALAACERLLQRQDRTADSKIEILHRVGEIYTRMDEPARAERAYRAALDVDPTHREALDALVRFYRLGGDVRSLRVHLDTVAGAMRKRLARVVLDDTAYGVLSRVLALREEAGATGSVSAAACAAEMAIALGAGDDNDARLAAAVRQQTPDVRGLGSFEIDDALFKRDVPNGLRQLLRAVDERLSKATNSDLKRFGVGRGDRIRPGGNPTADVIAQVGGALGIEDLEIYVSSRVPIGLAAETDGSEVRLFIGAELASIDDAARLRFLAGRALKMAVAGMSVALRMEANEFGALLVGLLRSFRPEFSPGGLDMGAVAEQQQRVRKVVSGGMLQELGPYAMECASLDFDHNRIWQGIQQTADRAGLMCAGSVQASVEAMMQLGGLADLRAASSDPMVQELMRFAVSEDHVVVRRMLAQAQARG